MDWIDYALEFGTNFTDNGSRVRVHDKRVRFEISVQRTNPTPIPAGNFGNIHMFTLDPEHRPGANPGSSSDFQVAVGENGAGGLVSFSLETATGEVSLNYATLAINDTDRLRAVLT